MITQEIPEVDCITHFIPIVNIEDEQKFDGQLIQTIAKIIEVLPSLDV